MRMAFLCAAALAAAVSCDGAAFEVRWEGRPLAVHPARVSKLPMNQVWSGYQRPIEQTEVASFVSFDMEGPGSLEIVHGSEKCAHEPVILPLSFAPPVSNDGQRLVVRIDRPRQFVVWFGEGKSALHVFANPLFKVQHGGDEIVFGPGEHHVGVVVPKSGQTIRIEDGAVVYGSILVAHAHDVKIVGRGIVDGSFLDRSDRSCAVYRAAVEAGLPGTPYGAEMAVTAFTSAWSTNVLVEGVTFRDPARWTMIVRAQSKNVTIDNVKIVGCWRYNSDGINVCASEDVTIRNSFIRSFDDCIVARGASLDCGEGPTRNVLAENCVLWCDWGKNLEVWAGSRPCLIENVTYRGIACAKVGTTYACDVTTWFGSSDTRIRNVAFEDIELDFVVPRLSERHQRSPADMKYDGGEMQSCSVFMVNSVKYGHNLGNQKFTAATDLSQFHARYENIEFRRLSLLGDVPPDVNGCVDATPSPLVIEGVKLEGIPESVRVEMLGDVSRKGVAQ